MYRFMLGLVICLVVGFCDLVFEFGDVFGECVCVVVRIGFGCMEGGIVFLLVDVEVVCGVD